MDSEGHENNVAGKPQSVEEVARPLEKGYLAKNPGSPRDPQVMAEEEADRRKGIVKPPPQPPDLSMQRPAPVDTPPRPEQTSSKVADKQDSADQAAPEQLPEERQKGFWHKIRGLFGK